MPMVYHKPLDSQYVCQHGLVLLLVIGSAAAQEPGKPQTLLPIPADNERAAAREIVEELYAAELRERSSAKKQALAKQLVSDAGMPENSPAQRFVMLETANDLYTQAGDAAGIAATTALLASQFEIPQMELSLTLLTKAAPAASTPDKAAALASQGLERLQQAVLENRLEMAAQFGTLAESAAQRSRQPELRTLAKNRVRDLQLYVAEHAQSLTSEATLKSNAKDAGAQLSLGRFRCFWQDDWGRGLPMLAEGSDDELKQLAQDDLAEPSAADALQVGHRWWNAAENEPGVVKSSMRHRAAHWYAITLSEQSGLTRSLVEKRLDEVKRDDKFLTRPIAAGSPTSVRGRFLGMCKGTGAVWVNGQGVAEIKGENTPVSRSTVLRPGDVVVLQVESGFVYRAAKFAFASDDGTCYLPIQRASLRNVTDLELTAVTAEAISRLEGSPGGGRPEDNYRKSWEKSAPRFEESEWFFGPSRGTFRFAFIVDTANFIELTSP